MVGQPGAEQIRAICLFLLVRRTLPGPPWSLLSMVMTSQSDYRTDMDIAPHHSFIRLSENQINQIFLKYTKKESIDVFSITLPWVFSREGTSTRRGSSQSSQIFFRSILTFTLSTQHGEYFVSILFSVKFCIYISHTWYPCQLTPFFYVLYLRKNTSIYRLKCL